MNTLTRPIAIDFLLYYVKAVGPPEKFILAASRNMSWRQGVIYYMISTQIHQFDGLVQDCGNSSALAMELLQSCTKSSSLSTPCPPCLQHASCSILVGSSGLNLKCNGIALYAYKMFTLHAISTLKVLKISLRHSQSRCLCITIDSKLIACDVIVIS